MAAETAIKKQETDVARAEQMRDRVTYAPLVDIVEEPDGIWLLADMPGVKASNVDIQYEQGLLTIHGRVEPRQEETSVNYLLREYGVGDYCRTFRIGDGIDPNKIEAELKNGVMHLFLPKTEALKPRKITVKSQ